MSDWYGVSRREVEEIGGEVLFQHGNSLPKLLKKVYPDFDWDLGRFVLKTGRSLKKDSLLAALTTIEQRLGIQNVRSSALASIGST